MGFTTGLLGGLTLTTGLLYLTISAHRANRLSQAMLIRQNTLVLNHLSSGSSSLLRREPALSPSVPPLDPTSSTSDSQPYTLEADPSSVYGSRRKLRELRDREAEPIGVLETAKEMWNSRLERAVRVAQNTDWNMVRDMAEERLGMVYAWTRRDVGVVREVERKVEDKTA